MYGWLRDALGENAEVVTASRRLARELRRAYDDAQQEAGKEAWLTPEIRSWHDWLGRQLSAVTDPAGLPVRLDALSASVLWERCLRRELPEGLLGLGGIVRQASQAWQLLHDWRVPFDELTPSARSHDERLFARAAGEYRQSLTDGGWIDHAGMAGLVAGLLQQDAVPAPRRVVFAGFDRLVPAVDMLKQTLEAAGCAVDVAPTPDQDTRVSVAAFDVQAAELRAAGAWARDLLVQDSRARLAIVSPSLETDAGRTRRLVLEGLAPGWQYGGAGYEAAANVSYGRRLAEYPAISIALLVLRWISHGLTSRELSILLRGRSIGSGVIAEIAGRCRLELLLRSFPDRAWSAKEFLGLFEDNDDARHFLDKVGHVASFSDQADVTRSPVEWAKRIDELLAATGWPGDESLDSDEFQLVNRWREALNEFGRIETVAPEISFRAAAQRLATLAADTLYQPESGHGGVQVLGTLEAAGMQFDGIWVCGLDATQWPPSTRPSAFLSYALQREYGMPDATPGDTLEFSRRVLERLIGSAPECVLSWSRTKDDAELTASTLLDDIGTTANEGQSDPGWHAARLVNTGDIVVHADDPAPPVAADEKVRGGAYTVQRQYVEPLGAFVHGRLGARVPDIIQPGLSPSIRGNMIHNALHNLLAGKPTRAEVCGWLDEDRDRYIGAAIDAALAEHVARADPVTRRIIALERERLRSLLKVFVEAECGREEFTVADVEKTVDYEASGVRLGMRIDRIDRLADGSLAVIDYKTGAPKHFLTGDGDLTDLQLVVYADALGESIGGLALINIDSRTITYKAVGAGWDGGDESEWQSRLADWRAEVHKALRGIAAGDVRINLLQSVSEGRPLAILSRIEEQKRAL